MQGYTAQAVATADQIVIGADVITGHNERNTLEALIDSARAELERAGVRSPVEVALADAGFWNTEQIERLSARGIGPLVKPDAGHRKTPGQTRRRRAHYRQMREQLASLLKLCRHGLATVPAKPASAPIPELIAGPQTASTTSPRLASPRHATPGQARPADG